MPEFTKEGNNWKFSCVAYKENPKNLTEYENNITNILWKRNIEMLFTNMRIRQGIIPQ